MVSVLWLGSLKNVECTLLESLAETNIPKSIKGIRMKCDGDGWGQIGLEHNTSWLCKMDYKS